MSWNTPSGPLVVAVRRRNYGIRFATSLTAKADQIEFST